MSAVIICSNVYDINFNRWSCALSLIMTSITAGSIGGQIGGLIGQYDLLSRTYSNLQTKILTNLDRIKSFQNPEPWTLQAPMSVEQAEFYANIVIRNLKTAMQTAYSTLIFVNTQIGSVCLTTPLAIGLVTAILKDSTLMPTFCYTNNVDNIISINSNTIILPTGLIANVQTNSDESIQQVANLTNSIVYIDFTNSTGYEEYNLEKCSFTVEEVYNAISSIKLNFAEAKKYSVLY